MKVILCWAVEAKNLSKAFHVDDDNIKHWVLPEVHGNIVGESGEAVIPQTVEDIEALHKQVYEEALQKGREEGLKQGREEGLADMQAKAKQLEQMFNYFEHPLQTLDQDIDRQLTELALSVSRLVIKKATVADAEHIQNLVHEAISFLPVNSRNISVRLNTFDRQLLEQAGVDTEAQDWACISDDSITQGGCIIESASSHIDATLEKRLAEVFEQLSQDQTDDTAD